MHRRLALSIIRYLLSLLVFIIAGLSVFIWWALGNSLPEKSLLEVAEVAQGVVPPPPALLSVVSYNIGHGQGIKEHAWDYRDKATTERQLNDIANKMTQMNADIFLLQEVDIDSNRTYRINQIEFLKQRTGHAYHACANVWEKNYLPFPYWPPSHHLGYIRAANCILSRYPLSNHQRIIFAKPESNSFFYNLGYIDRGIERVDVELGDRKIAIINLHLEACGDKTRKQQIKITKEYMDGIEIPIVMGGDFNTIMPDASKKTGFIDDPKADYAQDQTLAWLIGNDKNLVVPHLDSPSNNPFDLYTFPSNQPDRRLDHIFLRGGHLSFSIFRVVAEAGRASDHLPLMARLSY